MPTTTPAAAAPGGRPPRGAARWLLASNGLDAAGRSATGIVVEVLAVLVLGAGAMQMGVLGMLGTLGYLVFGIPVGVLVDRHLSPRLLVAAGFVKGGLLATVLVALALDALTFWHLAAASALVGVAAVVSETAQTALVPRTVPRDAVPRQIARLESADSALGIIVPAGTGLLVAAAGAGPALAVAAACTAAAALAALRVRMGPHPPREELADVEDGADGPSSARAAWRALFADARDGWRAVRRTPVLWWLSLGSMTANAGMSAFAAIEPLFVLDTLGLSPVFLGVVAGAGSAAALVGSLLVTPFAARVGERAAVLTAQAALVASVALHVAAFLDQGRAAAWLLAGGALWGVAIVVNNVTQQSVAARVSSPEVLGRVMAFRRTLTMGVVPGAMLGGGALGAVAGPGAVLAAWLGLAVVGAVLAAVAVRNLPAAGDGTVRRRRVRGGA